MSSELLEKELKRKGISLEPDQLGFFYDTILYGKYNSMPCVIKFFAEPMEFHREKTALKELKGVANVPELYFTGAVSKAVAEFHSTEYVVMERVNAKEVIDIPVESRIPSIIQATYEFEKIHSAGFVHTDAAVRNVLYNGTPTIIDFEFTDRIGVPIDWTGEGLDPELFPPESSSTVPRTPEVDTYALGNNLIFLYLDWFSMNNKPNWRFGTPDNYKTPLLDFRKMMHTPDRPKTMIELRETLEDLEHRIS